MDEVGAAVRVGPGVVSAAGGSRLVLVGAYAFPFGDATSNRLRQLVRSAAPAGTSAVVVNDWPCDGSVAYRGPDPAGIELVTLRTRGRNRLTRAFLRAVRPWRVLRALRRRGVVGGDVGAVLLPTAMMNLTSWVAFRLVLRCPVVVDAGERHDRAQFRRGWLTPYFLRHRWSMFLTTWLADRVIVVSSTLAEYFSRRGLALLVVPPQVDCDEFDEPGPPSLTTGLRLLYAGTPGRKDMLNVLIEGIRLLPPQAQARISLRIAGISRSQAGAMSDLSEATLSGLSADVEFLGRLPRDRVLDLLATSHLSVLVRPAGGYAAHGFPSKVPESLAAGCPVFLNHTSDLARHIHDGAEGVVLRGSTSEDVRQGLERALSLDDAAWWGMSAAARSRARDFFDYRAWQPAVSQFVMHGPIEHSGLTRDAHRR
jgi:glycosyltransferase involved in cell wall biosynthesis